MPNAPAPDQVRGLEPGYRLGPSRKLCLSPMNRLTHMASRTMVNGKPVETAMACSAVKAPAPPPTSNVVATTHNGNR